MFVRSSMSVPVRYSKSRGSVILKPNTVTFVDETLVTAKELKDCYGDRIAILSQDVVEQIIQEEAPRANTESQDSEIDNTPDEGKDENEANTGDKEVDDFLNGKTENVPEGTTEITEEEALKLQKEAEEKAEAERLAKEEAEAKAKAEAEKAAKEKAAAKSKQQNKSKAGKNK